MNKNDIIDECIDMSFYISKEEIEVIIKRVTGHKYMKINMNSSLWKEVHKLMKNILKDKREEMK